MKKLICGFVISVLGLSLFAYDIASEVKIKGSVKNYTRTDFSVVSKFGEYFRTPSTKTVYSIDSAGNVLESTETTARDVLINKISNK